MASDLETTSTPSQRQIRLLDRISDAFRSVSPAEPADDALFTWRHLQAMEKIGEGGFGEVYRAYDPQLRRDVALKLSRAEGGDRLAREAVMAEARRMARLRHPNILAVHGADEADGRIGIWFDLLRGETLELLCEQQGRLSPEAVLELALPIASALSLIHARGLVHGDIKPSNIMVLEDRDPVLMDFGAASEALSPLPQTAGSPLLMAPEQFTGDAASPATDIYALGATLYWALVGQFPCNAESYEALAELHERAPAVDFRGMPRSWKKLLADLLARDPHKRPSADQIDSRLRHIAGARQRFKRRAALTLVVGSMMVATVAALSSARTQSLAQQRTEAVKGVLVKAIQSVSPITSSSPGTIQNLYLNLQDLAEEFLDEFPQGQADVLLAAAQGLANYEQPERAVASAERGVALLESDPTTSLHSLITGYNMLSTVYNATQRYEAAVSTSRKVLALLEEQSYEAAADHRLVAHNKIYFALDGMGRWREALAAQRELLAARSNYFGADSLRVAVDHHNLSATLMQFGLYDEAVSQSERAVGILEHHGEGASTRMGIAMSALARGQLGRGDIAAAAQTQQTARHLLAASLGPDHSRVRNLDLLQARIELARGQQREGLRQLTAMRNEASLSARDRFEVSKLLAEAAMDDEQWTAASEFLDEAVERMPDSVRLLRPVLDAMRAFCKFHDGRSEASPLPKIQSTLADLDNQGLEGVWGTDRLRRWVAAGTP